ncbi:hypothetical protein [Acinetobacter stercoris]|uniref:Uncharacterized protein n=1 Tax=Acinetobacter stercoris TaxID=2126983 RepID=A0A2U3N2H1_9GAMM|nr:hypothetical protein [Acinetobacter stercoris]SPL71739.1 hypothetical protein KPC_2917 [Acinetobacter stercoris]
MSEFIPLNSEIKSITSQLKVFNETTVQVKYRDTADINAGTSTISADTLSFDLTNGYTEQILTGSVRFKLGTETFIDRTGTLYKNIDPLTNSGTSAGSIFYGTGNVQITSWKANTSSTVTLESLTTTTDIQPINHVSFRVPVIPVRPGSLTVVLATLEYGQLTLRADDKGYIESTYAHGKINYDMGFVDIYFYKKTEITEANRSEIESKEWYLSELEIMDGTKTFINVPVWVSPESVRYNAISYSYIPLDSEILGLSATRLPINGQVPIFRIGDIGIISSSQSMQLPDCIAGQSYELPDQRISWCELEDCAGAKVNTSMYVVDYDYGIVTLSGDFALNNLEAPLIVRYRYQDMGLIRDVQINGQISLTKPVTHNYQAEDSIVGSALVIGDMQARYTYKFVQQTWNSVWANEASGSAISANYNDALYPIIVTNNGAIQERWAIVFTDTTYKIIGETSGQIATGSINSDIAPINPVTGVPYFVIKKEGWGSGWVNGNVLRFNTIAATYPVWCIRTVKQSEPTTLSDQFQIMLRGDIDRVI